MQDLYVFNRKPHISPGIIAALVVVTVFIFVNLVYFTLIRSRTRKKESPTLPTHIVSKPQPSFAERHLQSLRAWQKPSPSPSSTPMQVLKVDHNHLSLMTQPSMAHQPTRPVKGSWQEFKERQAKREAERAVQQPVGEWCHKPKSAEYWAQVGRERQARKPWWEKMRDAVKM